MKYKSKTIILLIFFCTGIIAGCNKSSPTQASIVGAWTFSNFEEKLYVNHVLAFDTNISSNSFARPVAFNFGADGFYTEITSSGTVGSAYTYSNNVLSIFDTSVNSHVWSRLAISSLTDHSFSIADTQTVGYDSIGVFFDTFTR